MVHSEPADHIRLATQFTAMAEQYIADAARHDVMAQAFAGNAKLAHMAATQREHCRQLAARNRQSAATLRQLAAHHATLAAGHDSEPPVGGNGFQPTIRKPVPTDAEFAKLAASAETAAEHRALEGYFTALATRYDQESKESTAYASIWRGMTRNPAASGVARLWEQLARQQREAGAEARAAAAMHADLATKGR